MIEFQGFGKIPRLFREVVITEKIDGTNGAIGIVFESYEPSQTVPFIPDNVKVVDRGGVEVNGMLNFALVYAQSRNRIINPAEDNHGFARWIWDNATSLIDDLGPGLHFGEWWGQGIGRKYGLTEKRFSLFNVKRWENAIFKTPQLGAVPVLDRGVFFTGLIDCALDELKTSGSIAAPGFMKPEGIVIYHTAGNQLFKATIENDEVPKVLARREMELAA